MTNEADDKANPIKTHANKHNLLILNIKGP